VKTLLSVIVTGAVLLGGCGGDELPSRDQIPILRQRVYALEESVRTRNRAALDSLLSVDILDAHENCDSLLSFVYGADGRFPFAKFGDYTIFFSKDIGVVDCFVMDSTENRDRPLRLMYKLDGKLWLLTEFKTGYPDSTALM
jgi:hypothetical protein